MSETSTWNLRDRGRGLRVEAWVADGRNHARLVVDGEEVAAGDTDTIGDVKLSSGATHVKVAFWWRGRVGSCDLHDRSDDAAPLEDGDDPFKAVRLVTTKVPFAPPPGTRAARTHAWREAHPGLWAARHAAIQVGAILVAVLGISALVSALVGKLIPAIDWGWLSSVTVPEWLRYLNPGYWLAKVLPDLDWFGWVPDIDLPDLGWVKYVVILSIAVATGIHEVRKRQEREQREAGPTSEEPAADAVDEETGRTDPS